MQKRLIVLRKLLINCMKEDFLEYIDIIDGYSLMIDDLEITFKNNQSHSIESFMIKLENQDFKIIYTSDVGTTNFSELVKFCKDADLIISESTFLTEDNPTIDTHLRAFDAATLAKKANAKRLLLTHFWPEYDKKRYLEEASLVFSSCEVAEERKRLILKK